MQDQPQELEILLRKEHEMSMTEKLVYVTENPAYGDRWVYITNDYLAEHIYIIDSAYAEEAVYITDDPLPSLVHVDFVYVTNPEALPERYRPRKERHEESQLHQEEPYEGSYGYSYEPSVRPSKGKIPAAAVENLVLGIVLLIAGLIFVGRWFSYPLIGYGTFVLLWGLIQSLSKRNE